MLSVKDKKRFYEKIYGGAIDASCKSLGMSGVISGIHFSPSLNHRETFLIGKPPGVKKRDEALIDPFNGLVWLGLTLSLCGMLLSLTLVSQLSPWLKLDFLESFTLVLSIMFKEPIPDNKIKLENSLSRNVLLFTWLLTGTLLSMAYSSNLLASLVKDEQEKPMDTFQDILDAVITVYLNGKTPAQQELASSPVGIVKEVYEKQVLAKEGAIYRMPDSQVYEFAKRTIASGKGIFDNIEIRQHGVKHLFRRGKETTFMSTPTTYYEALNNPVLDKFNRNFQYMIDSGIYKGHLQAKYVFDMEFSEREFYRNEPDQPRWRKLSMIHLKSMFYTFIVPTMAIAVFCAETGAALVMAKSVKSLLLQLNSFLATKMHQLNKTFKVGVSTLRQRSAESLRSIRGHNMEYKLQTMTRKKLHSIQNQ